MPDDPKNLSPTGDQLKAVWGDGYGNRNDRFLACIAYLDGIYPSVVMARGYYTRTVLAAWDFRGGKLSSRWVFDTNAPGNGKFAGEGNHNLSVGDVNGDGKDDVIYGHMVVNSDGKGLWSTGIGHGDALHLTDIDPARPGLEIFGIQERFDDAGAHLLDAQTGAILWKKASTQKQTDKKVEGPGRGVALDIDPRTPGLECWAAGAGLWGQVFDARGDLIPTEGKAPPCNMGIYWDGDFLGELLDGTTISKWDWEKSEAKPLLEAKNFDAVSNNSTKANPVLAADLWGDWREEVIYRTMDNQELRVFSTTIPTKHRLPTLMSDHIYRMDIAWQNVGYNQPAHLSYYLDPRADYPAGAPQIIANADAANPDAANPDAANPDATNADAANTNSADPNALKFSFDAGAVTLGYRAVTNATRYDDAIGYGFEGENQFSARVPEGFYDVTVTLGGAQAATTSVKAEARRLMLQNVATAPGASVQRTFSVAVKRPDLEGKGNLRLKASQDPRNWDDRLTLEWGGAKPAVRTLEIVPACKPVGVFIAGDSTVTDQGGEPYTGWGQSLPRFFKAGAVVYNNAQSGDTLASFAAAGLEQKIWEQAQPGDYLLIQFGHNDQKDKSPDALDKYKANLRKLVANARARKITPVLVTPMERRIFKGGALVPSLADNAAAMREVGAAEKVAVIDLNAASIELFNTLGAEGSKAAFVHYAAGTFPGQDRALRDDSHFNGYGAYELARIVANGLRAQQPNLAKFLTDDAAPFDPSKPDKAEALALFVSAPRLAGQPEGS